MNKNEIIKVIENYAPLQTQEVWDNSGWQINLPQKEDVKRVMLCVSVTCDVISQAIKNNADLIIAHHPLIFPYLKNIKNEILINAIKNDILIYSSHTNFDKAGITSSGLLANSLGFLNLQKAGDYIQVAPLDEPMQLDTLILKTKLLLNIEKIKVINFSANKLVKKIAFVAGAGAEFVDTITDCGADVFITADFKYHDEEKISGFSVLDIGHLESEKPVVKKFEELLRNQEVEIFIADEKTKKIYI